MLLGHTLSAVRLGTHRPAAVHQAGHADLSLEGQVQSGLNLFLHLKSPAQMPALLATIQAHQQDVYAALQGLHYVHFARFLPSLDGSALMVITVFDGPARTKDDPKSMTVDPAVFEFAMKSYIMDFVAVLGPVFTAILEFVQNAPRLPVEKYPDDFWAFIQQNNVAQVQPWSAYPDMTVIDIQNAHRVR
jgi:hypothetical protein